MADIPQTGFDFQFDNDAEVEKFNKNEQEAEAMVMQMRERLKDTLQDRKEFEMEFVSLKKNYMKLKQQAKDLQAQADGNSDELAKELATARNQLEMIRASNGGQDSKLSIELQMKLKALEVEHSIALETKDLEMQELLDQHRAEHKA